MGFGLTSAWVDLIRLLNLDLVWLDFGFGSILIGFLLSWLSSARILLGFGFSGALKLCKKKEIQGNPSNS